MLSKNKYHAESLDNGSIPAVPEVCDGVTSNLPLGLQLQGLFDVASRTGLSASPLSVPLLQRLLVLFNAF